MLRAWTIGRATGIGAAAGLVALVLWPLYAAYQEPVRIAFIAALAVAAFCGLSILLITGADVLTQKRGASIRPIRAFDVVLGLALSVPSIVQLRSLLE